MVRKAPSGVSDLVTNSAKMYPIRTLSRFAAILGAQRSWSKRTFGPSLRTLGVTEHIAKELDEIRADPTDLEEWVDVMILGFDGAWRTGAEPQEILEAYISKMEKNFARTWPDWHVRDGE